MVVCCGYFWVVRRPKESVAALKKRLSGAGKNFHVVNLTLTVLETCVKNCGQRFHVKIAQKDFLSELVKIINPKVCLELYKIGDLSPPQNGLSIDFKAAAYKGDKLCLCAVLCVGDRVCSVLVSSEVCCVQGKDLLHVGSCPSTGPDGGRLHT